MSDVFFILLYLQMGKREIRIRKIKTNPQVPEVPQVCCYCDYTGSGTSRGHISNSEQIELKRCIPILMVPLDSFESWFLKDFI